MIWIDWTSSCGAVLELLKNIFNVDHCVFVLAIDYQVVVKELDTSLESLIPITNGSLEPSSTIIQLPFMMQWEVRSRQLHQQLVSENIGYMR